MTTHSVPQLMRYTLSFCGIVLLFVFGAYQPAFAQVDTLWTRTYDLGHGANLYAITELQSGGFAGAGFVLSGSADDAVIVRVDPLGDSTWVRTIGILDSGERAFDIEQLSNGTIVVCGYSRSGLASLVAGFSQTGTQLWMHEYDPVGSSQASAILPLPDGGFWLLSRESVNPPDLDFWLIRCDANGDSLYSHTYGTIGHDIPEEILHGVDGNIELIGSARNNTTQQFDFLHITVSSTGNFIRQRVFGGDLWEIVYCATRDSISGDLLIAGDIRDGSDRDGYAIKLDAAGEQIWDESYTDGRLSEKITGVAPYLEGGALFAGNTGGSVSSTQLWLMSVGVNGDTSWTWTGTQTGRAFEDLVRISDGGFVACGRALIGGYDKCLMWRISPPSGISGVVRDRLTNELIPGCRVSARELPQYSVSDTVGRFTLALPPGNYTMHTGGPCFSGDTLYNIEVIANENTTRDITVGVAHLSMGHTTINVLGQNHEQGTADLKISNAGSGDLVYSFESIPVSPPTQWLRVEPPSGRLAPGDTLLAQVIVEADTTNDGTYDYFGEINLHTNSCPDTVRHIEVLAVVLDADSDPVLPSEFALYPAFPNPFNSTTRLRFGLDHESQVSLIVYDITGREVATLLNNSRLSAGEHQLNWTANGLSSGLYFVRLQDNTRSQTQRLLYIR